jgi:hypothetical protein
MNAHPRLGYLALVTFLPAVCPSPLLAADEPPTTEVAVASHPDLSSRHLATLLEPAQSDWHKQYDTAKARKASGKKKMFIGLALDGAGIATIFAAGSSCGIDDAIRNGCSGNISAMTIGGLMGAGGGITFIWGLIEYIDGNGDVRSLESQRPAAQNQAAAVPLGDHQALSFTLGQGSSVGYRVSW